MLRIFRDDDSGYFPAPTTAVIREATLWLSGIHWALIGNWIPDKCCAFSGMTNWAGISQDDDSGHFPAPTMAVIPEATQRLSGIYWALIGAWIPDKCYAFSGMTNWGYFPG